MTFLRNAACAVPLVCLSLSGAAAGPIHEAARGGDLALVTQLLAGGQGLEVRDDTAETNPPKQYDVEAFGGNLQANFDEADAREFPQVIYDKIAAKITRQTTFLQLSSDGSVRWSTRTLRLVSFVKAPSPTYADTYLFAMGYDVSVFSELDSLAVHDTSCQVTVVYKHKEWSEPTVECAPVNLNQPNPS